MMSIKNRIERIEEEANAGKELCRHLPPVIHWPDGRVENESPHACDSPRLVIMLGYSDGSDGRTERAAVQTYDGIRCRLPELSAAEAAEIVAREFQLIPQARRALLEHAGMVKA